MLTDADRQEIRDLADAGESRRAIAARFGVSASQVSRIVTPGSVPIGRVQGVVNLDVLPDLFGEAEARGQAIVFECAEEPHAATRRLMAALGVEVIVTAQAFETLDCVTPLCVDTAIKGSDHCRRHASIAEIRAANGDGNGLAALEAMDAGLPQPVISQGPYETASSFPTTDEGPKPEVVGSVPAEEIQADRTKVDAHIEPTARGHAKRGPMSAETKQKIRDGIRRSRAAKPRKGTWTLDAAVVAVQKFVEENGRPPKSLDGGLKNGLPSLPFSFGGGWGDLLEAAGYPRYKPGGRPQSSGRAAAGQEPTAPVEEFVAPPDINSAASRDLEAVSPASGDEDAARPDTSLVQKPLIKEAVEGHAETESHSESDGGGFTLALTGDFTRDAQRVRDEAAKLRSQAEALDVIATGIDQLAETVL